MKRYQVVGMLCKGKKCDLCGRRRKRLVLATDICEHILCVVCYTSMVINSDRCCRRLNVDFYVMCIVCDEEFKHEKVSFEGNRKQYG